MDSIRGLEDSNDVVNSQNVNGVFGGLSVVSHRTMAIVFCFASRMNDCGPIQILKVWPHTMSTC